MPTHEHFCSITCGTELLTAKSVPSSSRRQWTRQPKSVHVASPVTDFKPRGLQRAASRICLAHPAVLMATCRSGHGLRAMATEQLWQRARSVAAEVVLADCQAVLSQVTSRTSVWPGCACAADACFAATARLPIRLSAATSAEPMPLLALLLLLLSEGKDFAHAIGDSVDACFCAAAD